MIFQMGEWVGELSCLLGRDIIFEIHIRIRYLHVVKGGSASTRCFCVCLTVCCVCVRFCCQLGGEEDRVWAHPVLEPHHTHHTVGEAYQVSTLCSLCRISKPDLLNQTAAGWWKSTSLASVLPNWGALEKNWVGSLKGGKKNKKKVSDKLLQTVALNDTEELRRAEMKASLFFLCLFFLGSFFFFLMSQATSFVFITRFWRQPHSSVNYWTPPTCLFALSGRHRSTPAPAVL